MRKGDVKALDDERHLNKFSIASEEFEA